MFWDESEVVIVRGKEPRFYDGGVSVLLAGRRERKRFAD